MVKRVIFVSYKLKTIARWPENTRSHGYQHQEAKGDTFMSHNCFFFGHSNNLTWIYARVENFASQRSLEQREVSRSFSE